MHKYVTASHARSRLKRAVKMEGLLCPDVEHVILGRKGFAIMSLRDTHGLCTVMSDGRRDIAEAVPTLSDEAKRIELLVNGVLERYGLEDEERR